MNVLILGSGGREHAFAWKIAQSSSCNNLFIAPGNAGTEKVGTNININTNDFNSIKNFVIKEEVSLVLVGPEDPLVNGIYDFFQEDEKLQHISVIPSKQGAQLEGSKSLQKNSCFDTIFLLQNINLLQKTLKEGCDFLQSLAPPYVLKADGVAGGKGVLILDDINHAKAELKAMVSDAKFGKASSTVVIEEFLAGIELSVFVLTDGDSYKILPSAKDYKRIEEGDAGLNTGGMGAVSPVPFADRFYIEKVEREIIKPTIEGLKKKILYTKGLSFSVLST